MKSFLRWCVRGFCQICLHVQRWRRNCLEHHNLCAMEFLRNGIIPLYKHMHLYAHKTHASNVFFF